MPPLKMFTTNHDYSNKNNKCLAVTQNTTSSAERHNSSPIPSYANLQYSLKLLSNFNSLRQANRFCDIILIGSVETKKFPAHRAVLSAASEYFEAMFRPELGLCEGKQKAVVLPTIDSEVLNNLLDFIYTGKVDINQSNVQELLAAADMLQLHEVVEGCCEFLCRELHCTNALGILRFAETHNCHNLLKAAMNFICLNFPAITQEDEFLDTPQNLLSQLLTSENLRVDSESQVFQAALRWIKHDIVQRRCHVFEMLALVRLALVPMRIIDQAIKECGDSSIQIALRSICRDIASRRGQLVPLRVNPRKSAKKFVYIIGGSKRETSSGWNPSSFIYETVAKYDIFRREWTETAMEIGRILPGVAALNGKIYVVGGEKGSQILANGEVYDPQNDTWQAISPMIVPRCEFGLCTMGGQLYAVGGWIGDDIGGSIESYDPIKDTWTMVDSLPEPRFSMGVVCFEGLIYVVGGCTTTSRHLPDLISYNPVTKEWNKLSPMQTARCQMGVAVLDRYLYVVGGNSNHQDVLCTVERYSFDDDKWTMVTPMSVSRAIPAVAAADGLLYVVGGDQVNFFFFY
ncbi:actin-binding protein IPP [Condylostylus longicornis]|uniref:actin-binding protein IPP n=1 Tax=Condylostylus longicornis TaxID=2530218 RepID=UPI00244DB273|nr:actin-binding protein IPP [Condylostylus longicornis]